MTTPRKIVSASPELQIASDQLSSLTQTPSLRFSTPVALPAPQVRLIRLDEINEEGHQAYRQALANVYATMDPNQSVRLLYLLDGGSGGVNLYFGVVADSSSSNLHDAMANLRGALEGQLPGINFGDEVAEKEKSALLDRLNLSTRQGVLLGTPTLQEQDQAGNSEQNFQDIDRLVRAMRSGNGANDSWQLAIVSQPLAQWQIHQQLDAAYALSSRVTMHISTNIQFGDNSSHQTGTSSGSSESHGTNSGTSHTTGDNKSSTKGSSTSDTTGENSSTTSGKNKGVTEGRNTSDTSGKNRGVSVGQNTSNTSGTNKGETLGTNSSKTSGKNASGSQSHGHQSQSNSAPESFTTGSSQSETLGTSSSRSTGFSTTKTAGTSSSRSIGSSTTQTVGTSSSQTQGSSASNTTGTSDSRTTGSSRSDTSTEGISFNSTTNDGTNESDTTGRSLNVSKEVTDKRAQHLVDYLDKQLISRLQKGLTKGLFHSAVYLAADNAALYQRLKNTVRATFQGGEITLAPLQVHDLPPGQLLRLPTLASESSADELLFRSLHASSSNHLGTLMTAEELAIIASLPQHELQGIRRRKAVEFVVDLPDVTDDPLRLGAIIDRGRLYPDNHVNLSRKDLNKHVFVTGVTGAGKTTTCMNLLLESGLPFLVIEPAKTEYRELASRLTDVDYYRPNGDDHQSLRINPFALIRRTQRIKSHAGFLKNVFAAIFPMEASMPAMVEAAILAAYEDKGWDVDDNEFLPGGDPFAPGSLAWPSMTDMIGQLDRIIPSFGLGKEFEEKYRGSLVSRLRSLTDGTLGQVLDVRQSISFDDLLDRRAVIELEELQSGEEKALLMALLLGGINEAIRARYASEPSFRHLTLIEEAHRLLSRPEPGDKSGALAVEAFADMLAEVRKYGEGLIIADQIPAKLIPDVIKNTHTKIVHRLFAEDDRRAMGETMMMDDEQRAFLPNLAAGRAIVFCGGWHGPAHAAIRKDRAQTDNHHKTPLDLNACGARQLWRERTRYYPNFCQLGWLSTDSEDPQLFARFVRETRQAQKQLLRLLALPDKSPLAPAAFERIKRWQKEWLPLAEDRLPEAWMALLMDGNPRPHAQYKDIPPIRPGTLLAEVSNQLMGMLNESASLTAWDRSLTSTSAVDLREHLRLLSKYKSF